MNFADDWIQTMDLSCRKRPLYTTDPQPLAILYDISMRSNIALWLIRSSFLLARLLTYIDCQ